MRKKHKGGISIFLIIVIMANFTFGGLFIDCTRILVAKNRVRTANEAAVRSTLAGYSDNLVSEWGLFGVTKSEAESSYKKYVKLNLSSDKSQNNAAVLNYDIVSTKVECERPLGDSSVFTEKINEYEKYRAPVSLTLGVIDKFKAIFGDENALDSINIDVKSIINGATDKMKTTYQNLSTISTNFDSQVDGSGASLNNDYSKSKLNEIDVDSLDKLKADIDKDIESSKTKVDDYKSSIQDYQNAGEDVQSKSDEVMEKVNTNGVNGEIDDSTTSKTKIDENITTYKNDIVTDNSEQIEKDKETESMRSKEEALIDSTNESADNANAKADALERTMNEKVEEAKRLATSYNSAKDEFNRSYDNLNIGISAAGINKTADDAMQTYPTQKAIDEAKKRVETIDNELSKKCEEYEKYKNVPKQSEVDEKEENAKKLRSQKVNWYQQFNQFNDGSYDASEAINAVYNNSGYDEIKKVFEEYKNKSENQNKDISLSDMSTYLDEKLTSLDKEVSELKSKIKTAKEIDDKIKELELKQKEDKYKFDKFAMENSSNILKLIEKKKAAKNLATQYNNKLKEIKKVNSKQEMGIDSVENFPKLAFENSGESDEQEGFDASELFNLGNEVKTLMEKFERTMPSASMVQESDLTAEGKSIDMFQRLLDYFNDLGEVISNPGDKFYLVDYIMSKCTYLTSQTKRNHYFEYGEVEYIIFGKDSQIENIALAVASITTMRFAINTINYWIKTPGELISRTVSAVVCGFTQTVVDMTTMLLDNKIGKDSDSVVNDKGLIAICPSLSEYKVLSYSDHLRILLLMKMSGDGGADALKRCIHATLKEQGEDIKDMYDTSDGTQKAWTSSQYLDEYYTQVKGEVEADVDLFFIPIFLPDFVNFGPIHDGKYRVKSSITYGY